MEMFIPLLLRDVLFLISFIHCIPTLLDPGDNMGGKRDSIMPHKPKKNHHFLSASVKLKLLSKKGEGSQGQQKEMKRERI